MWGNKTTQSEYPHFQLEIIITCKHVQNSQCNSYIRPPSPTTVPFSLRRKIFDLRAGGGAGASAGAGAGAGVGVGGRRGWPNDGEE